MPVKFFGSLDELAFLMSLLVSTFRVEMGFLVTCVNLPPSCRIESNLLLYSSLFSMT